MIAAHGWTELPASRRMWAMRPDPRRFLTHAVRRVARAEHPAQVLEELCGTTVPSVADALVVYLDEARA
ncbi:hypothetical protein KEF29_06895 [Streptomyces tuirus]|uniref:Uncharacterized protein n=1 Tax=Streptomyces tuirus TaxID=68278 RepID=A0A941FFM6_9ACTN|nr:hypothetical protein [Streptomyces tuirus]